ARLADLVGILPEYLDQSGTETRVTSDRTRVAILGALGIDAHDGKACEAELARLAEEDRKTPLEAVAVVGEGPIIVSVRSPESFRDAPFELLLTLEEGETRRQEGRLRGDGAIALPALPIGYHAVKLRVRDVEAEQLLVVAPSRCTHPSEVLGGQRGVGITLQLYSVVSERNQGIGDFTDLASIARWAGAHGASFVGVNPLHALRNAPGEISPYSPLTRLFKNPIYLDVEAVPELAQSEAARALLRSPQVREGLASLRSGERVDHARAFAIKMSILAELHRSFSALPEGSERKRAYRAFVAAEEPELTRFATFQALDAHFGDRRPWPEEYRAPESSAVQTFARANGAAIDLHRYLQFEIDRQLACVASAATQSRLRLGLYQDLAIGSAPGGSDTWAFPGLFVTRAAIGAPPDGYSKEGQNWGLPPIDPRALRAGRYRYFIRLVRNALRHAGALRIDHAVGLFRQFWIPQGLSGREGAYVRFPAEDLLGILALESRRRMAIVVGEDLGTVPAEVPPALHARGVLSSRVLYFERDERGRFLRASEYERDSLTTANTHDMPTLEGFFRGRDIAIKREVGLIASDEEARRAREDRRREKRELFRRLASEGVLPEAGGEPEASQVRAAIHAFLERTPASLVGISLDDLLGEEEPVNVPGVAPDKFESWTRKLAEPVERWTADDDVHAALPVPRD
ncbi:MAG TPA: 4-alpha-glucanotransferase, partial [Myxococcales bacterium]|nr:4-alpha-glucanotransferase [Myxococcales bacterium]